MTSNDLRVLLNNARLNSRGDHFISDCPFCEKEDHFYINILKCFNKSNGRYAPSWDCKKCGEKGNILKLLIKLDKASLLLDGVEVDVYKKLQTRLLKETIESENIDLSLRNVRLPFGFKRTKSLEYLNNRGFTDFEYSKYTIGTTKLVGDLEGYVIIAVNEGNKTKGFLSRSMLSKQEIKKINDKYKEEGLKTKYLRYKNSKNTQFNKLLFGYDEIMFDTEWVVLVEGFFDKVRVDQALQLDLDSSLKCVSTFGKSISIEQVRKLQRRGVSNVILIQDPDAVKDSKSNGFMLKNEFEHVLIGHTGSKDLGDSSYSEIIEVFNNLKNPMDFDVDILQTTRLN